MTPRVADNLVSIEALAAGIEPAVAELGRLDIVSANALALELAPERIRVNSLHPTQVDTPMIMNDAVYKLFLPGLERPTRDDFAPVSQSLNALPIPWVEPVDVSNAVLFLASDEARYVTGVPLPIDAGCLVK